MKLETFPSKEELELLAFNTPPYMWPNTVPIAVVLEGYLGADVCREISDTLSSELPYSFEGCGAMTREIDKHPVLDPIEEAARYLNFMYWEYDIDPGQHSWLQTYEAGMAYQRHADGRPGQMRKLTAVAMLSSEEAYEGGDLTLYYLPREFKIPRTRGTIAVFQSWTEHEVSPVLSGSRQTINMGFWGPQFK